MKRVKHPSGVDILFDAKWHQYKLGNTALRSVSKLLDRYFPFDEANVLRHVARKTGAPVETIKKGWARQALLGKNVHEYIECSLTGRPPPAFTLLLEAQGRAKQGRGEIADETEKKDAPEGAEKGSILHGEEGLYLPVAEAAVAAVRGGYDVLASELVVASPEWGIAGTIDLLAREKRTGRVLLADWKTTGSVSSSFRFGSFETPCTGCLRHLPNAKPYRYAMQLLIYGEILKQQRYIESGYLDKVLRGSCNGHQVDVAPLRKELAAELEYGLVQFSKSDEGNVVVEFKKVTEKTVLPPDEHEADFVQIMQKVMLGL
ncbi:unnamed protein product [Phytomonas sp. EM1]|nr:unnamed protein product [Phytomonas sp. EM1]|eukprot:CCW63800.1 unnamed protein product [Phytomonas sp. isolate EM1]